MKGLSIKTVEAAQRQVRTRKRQLNPPWVKKEEEFRLGSNEFSFYLCWHEHCGQSKEKRGPFFLICQYGYTFTAKENLAVRWRIKKKKKKKKKNIYFNTNYGRGSKNDVANQCLESAGDIIIGDISIDRLSETSSDPSVE